MGPSAVTRVFTVATEHLDPRSIDLDLRASTDVAALLIDSQREAVHTLSECIAPLAAAIDAAVARLRATDGRLIYAGAGTSGRLAVQDGVELWPTYSWPMDRLGFVLAGGLEAMVGSVEGAEDDTVAARAAMAALEPGGDDVVIGVAASGSTPFTVEAVRWARAAGALAIGLSSNDTCCRASITPSACARDRRWLQAQRGWPRVPCRRSPLIRSPPESWFGSAVSMVAEWSACAARIRNFGDARQRWWLACAG